MSWREALPQPSVDTRLRGLQIRIVAHEPFFKAEFGKSSNA
jgi:hypothetical protein